MSGTKEPCTVIKSVKLSNGKYNAPEEDVKGGILKACKCVWTACKAELRLYRTPVGNKIATWRLGSDILSPDGPAESGTEIPVGREPHVTCVCELPPRGAVTNCTSPQLLVGLDCGPGHGGVVCICDSSSGSIITTIKLAKPVSALTVVDGGTSAASRLLSSSITDMCGVAAAGLMSCGHVMLIDLRRHDPDGHHSTIFLNEASYTVPRKYALKGSDGTVRCHLPSARVDVTCIQYVPCITSLLVGYNFGCFEIWDLREMKLRYVSPVMEQTIPVAHITFQEPSDDPRNFCYVWTVHNHSGEVSENSSDTCHPVAFMYALCYQWKEWVDGCGYVYEGFKGCSQQFFFEMKTYENIETVGSSSLTCQAVGTSLSRQHRSLGPEDFDDSVVEGELSLCLFAWQSFDTDCKSKLRVALFDLDRWYKEEMPNSGHGSYIVVFHLEEVLSSWTSSALDVAVDESSLQPYRSDTGQEEYYRPSALSFVSRVLFVDELVELSHPGKQQYLLSCLDKSGPLALLHPTHIYKECLKIGLYPALFDVVSPSKDLPLDKQRRFLLALALEWQMSGFLHSCAVEWASGSQSVAGCSLPLLLTWGWEFALIVKEEACKLCAPLFDNSGTKLDRAGRRMLSMYRNQLSHLAKLFRGVLNSSKIPKMYVPESVDKQATALEMISLYFELVQWFMNAGLLPEFPDVSVTNEERFLMEEHRKVLPYPASAIKKFYDDRRAELGNDVPLFVDLLLEQDKSHKLKSLWMEDGGTGLYPPPSLQALLQTYLIDVLDATAKHCIVIYLFLDIADTLDERYAGAVNYLIKFPASVYMRPSVIKITQAMWLLDHKDFEEALRMLLDPMIQPTDMEQWQHRAIALAFLKQGKANLALDYILCRNISLETLEDIKLKISILVENNKVLEAYECQSMYSIGRSDQDLMEYFVSELVRNELLDQIFFLTLTPEEEKCFLRLMEKYPINISGSTALIYFLLQSRKVEAYWLADRVERKYNENYFNEELRTVPHRYVSKSTEGLPEIERKVAALFEHKSPVRITGIIPEPLSVTVNRYGSSDPSWFSSTGLETILRKTKETWVSDIVYDAESTVQKTPFLFAPHHLQLNRAINSARAVCVPDKKRRREDHVDSETPQKRRRVEDYGRTPNQSANKGTVLEQEVNVSALLDTPKIRRLSQLRTVGRESPRSTPVNDILHQQSILKGHSTPIRSMSSVDTAHEEVRKVSGQATLSHIVTDQKIGHKRTVEKNEHDSERLSLSRQIRFELPKESPRKSVIGVSPRKALSQIRNSTSKNTNSRTKRPLCFFPKSSNASFEREDPAHQAVQQLQEAKKSSYLTAHYNENINKSKDRNESRGPSIKGKYFFPPKPKLSNDSDENQDDSFVSATSDLNFSAESIECPENRNRSTTTIDSMSRVTGQFTSAPSDLARQTNYKTQTESKLVYQVSESVNNERSIFQSTSLLNHEEENMSSTKETLADRLSCSLDSTAESSPSPSHSTSRITKRKSYRSSNVSPISDNVIHESHFLMKFNSPIKNKMKSAGETEKNTSSKGKLIDSLIEIKSETATSSRLSLEKLTEKAGLPLISSTVGYESPDYTDRDMQPTNEIESPKLGSSTHKISNSCKLTTDSETNASCRVSVEKSTEKIVFSCEKGTVSYVCPDNTVNSVQSSIEIQQSKLENKTSSPGKSITKSETTASHRIFIEESTEETSPCTYGSVSYESSYNTLNDVKIKNEVQLAENEKQNESRNYFDVDNVHSPEKSTNGKHADTNDTTRKFTSDRVGSFLPENTIFIDLSDSVCSELSDRLPHFSDDVSNVNESLIIGSSSSCEVSLHMSGELSVNTEGNNSSPPKKLKSKSSKSFLPDNTIYNSPQDIFYIDKSVDEIISDVEEHKVNFTLADEEEIVEKSSTSVVAAIDEKTENGRTVFIPSFLPDTTVNVSPSEDKSFKSDQRSPCNVQENEINVSVTASGSSTSDVLSATSFSYREMNEKMSSCAMNKRSSKSFLPDSTIYCSPSDAVCIKISEDEKSQDDTKGIETNVYIDSGETSETLATAVMENKTEIVDPASEKQTESIIKKRVQSFLPNETKYDSHDESYDETQSESKQHETGAQKNLGHGMEDVTGTHFLPEDPETSPHANCDGNEASQSQEEQEEKDEECHETDNRNDDTDEDWHASAEEVFSEEEVEDEGTDPEEADESSSSSHHSYVIIISSDSSSSSDSSCSTSSSLLETKAIFNPSVDPESDTEEDVAALAASHGDEVADHESKTASNIGEEQKDVMKTESVPPEAQENTTQNTINLACPEPERDKESLVSDASVDIGHSQSGRSANVSGTSAESLSGHEVPSTAVPEQGSIANSVTEIVLNSVTEQKLKNRREVRDHSESTNSEYSLRTRKLKKAPSTSSVNKLSCSFTKKENSKSKVDNTDTTVKELEGGHESPTVETKSDNRPHEANELPELQYASTPVDIHKSIQEWINSPVVTRAGFRRLSSIQSEPPQMEDVADVETRARTRRKKTSSVIMESSFQKTSARQRNHLHLEPSGAQAANSVAQDAEREHQMEQYATERRLTRYQRSLLSKGVELTAARETHTRQRKVQSTPSPSKSSGTSRRSSPDRLLMPSPGDDADDISVAHSEESDLASVTTASTLQISPKSAHSENMRSTRRNRSSATRSPTSVKSLPVRPRKDSLRRGARKLSTDQRVKAGEESLEEQREASLSPPVRRTRSHSDISDGGSKSSKEKSHTSASKSDAKANLRVTRSQAKQGVHNVPVLTLHPIPEESGSSSADNQQTDTSNTDNRKRKHSSRSPAGNKKGTSTRISPRKAMKLRSRLLR